MSEHLKLALRKLSQEWSYNYTEHEQPPNKSRVQSNECLCGGQCPKCKQKARMKMQAP